MSDEQAPKSGQKRKAEEEPEDEVEQNILNQFYSLMIAISKFDTFSNYFKKQEG